VFNLFLIFFFWRVRFGVAIGRRMQRPTLNFTDGFAASNSLAQRQIRPTINREFAVRFLEQNCRCTVK